MNPLDSGTEGIKLCIALGLLLASYVLVHRRSCLASYRQSLFILRNQLWDFTRTNGTLSMPVHRRVRNVINGYIRAAPYTNILVIIPFLFFDQPEADERPIGDLIAELPEGDLKKKFRETYREVHFHLCCYLFLQTFPGMLIGWPLISFVVMLWFFMSVWAQIRRLGGTLYRIPISLVEMHNKFFGHVLGRYVTVFEPKAMAISRNRELLLR